MTPGEKQLQAASVGPATRIDAIWAAPPSEESASRFLDALLAEGLVCPAWAAEEAPAQTGAAEDASDENFAPVTVERDGIETFCLFDSVERLEASGLGASEFVAAPGRMFFELAAEAGAQIAFNPGVADSDSLFSVETVAMIADLSAAAEEDEMVGGDEAVEILPPPPPPEALLAALSARLAAASSAGQPVTEAWLVAIRRAGADDAAREGLTLVLGVAPGAEPASAGLGALARDLSRLGGLLVDEGASAVGAGGSGLDVALLAADERALSAARRVGFGLLQADES